MSQEKFAERMHITNQAIAHEEADRIPIWRQYGTTPFVLSDGMVTYRDSMYDYEKASEAIVKFHADFQPDAQLANMVSGKSRKSPRLPCSTGQGVLTARCQMRASTRRSNPS